MKSLNFMENLLDGIEVHWQPMGKIGNFVRGNGLQKKDFAESGVGCIHYGQIYTYYGTFAYQTKSFVSSILATKLRKAQKGDLIIATTSENIEDVCKPLVWLGEDEVCVSGETYIFKHNQNPKYLAYYLQTPMFFDFKKLNRTGTKVIRVHGDKLAEFPIPIPPLEIQTEIVRILDTFTALTAEITAEITAELTARKKQYTYYRDQLLTFKEGQVEWKALGEVCDYVDYRGKTPRKTTDGVFLVTAKNIRMGYIDYNTSQEFISSDDYALVMRRGLPKNGDVLITTEAPCGFIAQVDREDIALAQRVIKYRSKNKLLLNSFIKHYLKGCQFQAKLQKAATGSTVKGIKGSKLHKLTIPVPPLAEQARIVAILDKLDALNTSITEGLPREIELRQTQYEYYRNSLLTFPKEGVEL